MFDTKNTTVKLDLKTIGKTSQVTPKVTSVTKTRNYFVTTEFRRFPIRGTTTRQKRPSRHTVRSTRDLPTIPTTTPYYARCYPCYRQFTPVTTTVKTTVRSEEIATSEKQGFKSTEMPSLKVDDTGVYSLAYFGGNIIVVYVAYYFYQCILI
jgi:hypothetical protein